MWTKIEPWQLDQLKRLSQVDPERVETMLNTLWKSYPGLLADVAIAAVDQEQFSVADCAALLGIETSAVETRLRAFRQVQANADCQWAVVVDNNSSVAKLADSSISVWEIVREFRKLGSVERLTESFPSLAKSELAAALVYAEQNPAEIEEQILKYEEMLNKRRSEYPFVR